MTDQEQLNADREDHHPHPVIIPGQVPMFWLQLPKVSPDIESNRKDAWRAFEAEAPIESRTQAPIARHFRLDAVVMERVQAGTDGHIRIRKLSLEYPRQVQCYRNDADAGIAIGFVGAVGKVEVAQRRRPRILAMVARITPDRTSRSDGMACV